MESTRHKYEITKINENYSTRLVSNERKSCSESEGSGLSLMGGGERDLFWIGNLL